MARVLNDPKSNTNFTEINNNDNSYRFLENNILYQGQLFNNVAYNGYGRAIFTNGDIYEGNWNNNKMDGYGKYTTIDDQIYEGYWEQNQFIIWLGSLTYLNYQKSQQTLISLTRNSNKNSIQRIINQGLQNEQSVILKAIKNEGRMSKGTKLKKNLAKNKINKLRLKVMFRLKAKSAFKVPLSLLPDEMIVELVE